MADRCVFLSRWGGDEPATQIVLLFLLPFASYLIAEHIGVSGILAAVAAGDDHHPLWRNAPRAAGNAFAR
ncbi:Na+/H+ antiporter [Salmonella enterica subsp. salamae]|uniref:Na+/H+ antiporter n=1 Tax=Salmonella enterica subsp. salamae TaxID=59202 RepID=A0A6D2GDQ7_SALER|nr:Na+/H+ antiporter [Salmonella enterica subsp. salamae]